MFCNLAVFLCLLTLTAGNAAERVWDWSGARAGETPPGFRALLSGRGQPGRWNILLDEVPSLLPAISARATNHSVRPVLAQLSSDRTDERYPILVVEGETFSDFHLTTQLKIAAGVAEQMAGIAFRIQDERNYYYIRASALGQNVNFFKMQDGQLIGPIGTKVEVAKGIWHDLSIRCEGNQIQCTFNGREMLSLRDNTFSAGKIGFWTKSDSVSYFGETRISYKPREPIAQSIVRDITTRYPRLLGLKVLAAAPGSNNISVIASADPAEIGQAAQAEAADVIARGVIYHGTDKGKFLVTMPMRDNNGDCIAAVKVVLKSFPGQTEKNAVARALPIVKEIEARVRTAGELWQ